jgi:hypothetical protein
MNHKILGLLTVALLAGPMVANAQTETLDYTGSPFTSLSITGNSSTGLANAIPENVGELVLSSPLGDNLNNVAVTPVSYSFDSSTRFGSHYLNSGNPQSPGNSASFLFSTDATGMLTGWNISVIGGDFGGTNSPTWATVTISNAGDSFTTGLSTPSCEAPPGVPISCFSVSESNSAPGSWDATIARAPEIDPASAASGLTLLLGGVAVLRGRRKLG